MSAPEPRYLLAEDITDRVFVHEGRVWCALPPAGQRHEPVLDIFQEELDEEQGPLDEHLSDVVDDEGSIHAEEGHEGATRDSYEAPDLPATATATSSVASASDIIGAPIRLNRNDIKNVATGTVASVPIRLEVARICVVSTNVISFKEGDLKWIGLSSTRAGIPDALPAEDNSPATAVAVIKPNGLIGFNKTDAKKVLECIVPGFTDGLTFRGHLREHNYRATPSTAPTTAEESQTIQNEQEDDITEG